MTKAIGNTATKHFTLPFESKPSLFTIVATVVDQPLCGMKLVRSHTYISLCFIFIPFCFAFGMNIILYIAMFVRLPESRKHCLFNVRRELYVSVWAQYSRGG